jgi:hypothetical protein
MIFNQHTNTGIYRYIHLHIHTYCHADTRAHYKLLSATTASTAQIISTASSAALTTHASARIFETIVTASVHQLSSHGFKHSRTWGRASVRGRRKHLQSNLAGPGHTQTWLPSRDLHLSVRGRGLNNTCIFRPRVTLGSCWTVLMHTLYFVSSRVYGQGRELDAFQVCGSQLVVHSTLDVFRVCGSQLAVHSKVVHDSGRRLSPLNYSYHNPSCSWLLVAHAIV